MKNEQLKCVDLRGIRQMPDEASTTSPSHKHKSTEIKIKEVKWRDGFDGLLAARRARGHELNNKRRRVKWP